MDLRFVQSWEFKPSVGICVYGSRTTGANVVNDLYTRERLTIFIDHLAMKVDLSGSRLRAASQGAEVREHQEQNQVWLPVKFRIRARPPAYRRN